MEYSINVSTNILRDSSKQIDYIITPNAKEIYDRIFVHNYSSQRSFNLIGNYGTGKSTFLWALEKQLNRQKLYFGEDYISGITKINGFDFIKIIGETASMYDVFGKSLKLRGNIDNDKILASLERRRKTSIKKGNGLALVIDEFGKFLEYASKENRAQELYLLQLLSEWANDDAKDVYFIITLHQSFINYGKNLTHEDKLEWEKVKGRFADLLFNEPVEQLIYFASKRLAEFEVPKELTKRFDQLNKIIQSSNLINNRSQLDNELSKSLYPLDWLSATILVKSLQRYGQNERSLFSFLSDDSPYSIKNCGVDFYNVADIFNYLLNAIPTEISGSDNPHRPQWLSTFRALERCELIFKENYLLASEVVKTISLVNIFSRTGGRFDLNFINEYFQLTRGIDVSEILKRLDNTGIIRFYHHSNKINFLEGTDIDLEQELLSASKDINPNFSIDDEIEDLVKLPILLVKEYSFKIGTPRFFTFRVVTKLDSINEAKGVNDGFVNLLFSDISVSEIKNFSKGRQSNVFVKYQNLENIKEVIFTIKKFDFLIEKHASDINAARILNEERHFFRNKLQDLVIKQLFNSHLNQWYYNGRPVEIGDKHDLHKYLNTICERIYGETPILLNELINREYLTPPINAAKRLLIRQILENEAIKDLGFPENRFPPEKAIYYSLLRESGIHKKNQDYGFYELSEPEITSPLHGLWHTSIRFLESCNATKRPLTEFYDLLSLPPIKLKLGIVEFWIPIFLIAMREDYALFHTESGYIPFINEDTIDIMYRKPQDFYIKSYNVSGLKLNILEGYKELVKIDQIRLGTKTTFLTIFSNFLRFQRGLNRYSLQTNNLSSKAKKLRDAIVTAKDPEEALFVKFPSALGYPNLTFNEKDQILTSYTKQLQLAIREIRTAYDHLLDRIEKVIIESFFCKSSSFEEYKVEIIQKLRGIDVFTLGNEQAIFYKRLTSPLDERKSWLKSVVDIVLGKSIEELIDVEEHMLIKNIKDRIFGLLKAAEIQSFNKVSIDQKMYAFSFYEESGEALHDKLLISVDRTEKHNEVAKQIKNAIGQLTVEKRKAILLELLKKEFKSEEHVNS